MLLPGSMYGVGKRLIEEGIFTVQAIPIGPSLCLLEEIIEGDLDNFLIKGGAWITKWFKEVRAWESTDVECARAARISIYGVPCFVRNKKFLEALLSDIGVCPNLNFLNSKPSHLDVESSMIFTANLEMIRNKVSLCLDGKWINILIVEEAMVSMEEQGDDFEDKGSSSDMGDFSSSDSEDMEEEGPVWNDRHSIAEHEERNESDGSLQVKNGDMEKVKRKSKKSDCIYFPNVGLDGMVYYDGNTNGAESISTESSTFVACSIGNSVNKLIFDDEGAKQVVPGGTSLKLMKRKLVLGRIRKQMVLKKEMG